MNKSLIYLATSLLLMFSVTAAFAGDIYGLDPNYAKLYGWGAIIGTDKAFPGYKSFNSSLIKFKNGMSYVKAGSRELTFRALFKDGKNFYEYISAFKKNASKNDMKNWVQDLMQFDFWATRAEVYVTGGGTKIVEIPESKWPKKPGEVPDAEPIDTLTWKLRPESKKGDLGFAAHGLKVGDLPIDVRDWLKNAKAGDKMYVAFYIGYVKNVPSKKFWDKKELRYKIPIAYVRMDQPVATGTIVVE
jgi:hypothetical protein